MAKLIYYNSLTRKYTQCPICKAENSEELKAWYIDLFDNLREIYKCKECGARLEGLTERKGAVSDEIIEKAQKLCKKDKLN